MASVLLTVWLCMHRGMSLVYFE